MGSSICTNLSQVAAFYITRCTWCKKASKSPKSTQNCQLMSFERIKKNFTQLIMTVLLSVFAGRISLTMAPCWRSGTSIISQTGGRWWIPSVVEDSASWAEAEGMDTTQLKWSSSKTTLSVRQNSQVRQHFLFFSVWQLSCDWAIHYSPNK
jgi:hypothetical protein